MTFAHVRSAGENARSVIRSGFQKDPVHDHADSRSPRRGNACAYGKLGLAARALHELKGHAYSDHEATTVWTAIALHTTPGVPEFMVPEIALVTAGVETDVLGIGYLDLAPGDMNAVTHAHPRKEFKRQILEAFTEGNVNRPDTTFGNVNADVLSHFVPGFEYTNFVDVIRNSAWPD